MTIKHLEESERKFLLNSMLNLTSERNLTAFLILQWYERASDVSEKKIKLMLRGDSLDMNFVSVEKERTDNQNSNKIVSYLNYKDFDVEYLSSLPCIVKKRIVFNSYSVDQFLWSKVNGLIMLEVDNNDSIEFCHSYIEKEVTDDKSYRNCNLALVNDKLDWVELGQKLLLKLNI